jgi:hypothetical protein
MKKTLTLLVASTALTAAIGVPAWSALQTPANGGFRPFAALFEEGVQAMPLFLVSKDDDDDHYREGSRRGHDDDDDDYDDCDGDDEDEDDGCASSARNPAPAVTVAPPQNGLFGNATPPQVEMK